MIKKLREIDGFAKAGVIFFVMLLVYIVFICIVIPMIVSPGSVFAEEFVLSFETPSHRHFNLVSILFALLAGVLSSLFLRKESNETFTAVKNVLSPAEREIIKIVEECKEITQDSLLFRLGWSRAKVSTILTNLEKRNLVQRRREGKTYVVFLSKH